MMTPARIVRFIGIMGLVGWLGMVGWVAKTSQAQNGGQAPPPELPAPKQEIAGQAIDSPPPPPIAPRRHRKTRHLPPCPRTEGPQAPPPSRQPAEKLPATPEPVVRAIDRLLSPGGSVRRAPTTPNSRLSRSWSGARRKPRSI